MIIKEGYKVTTAQTTIDINDIGAQDFEGQPFESKESMADTQAISGICYRRIFESEKSGILILDAETRKIINANPFITEMLGYSHEEFIDKVIYNIELFKNIEASQNNYSKLQYTNYIPYDNFLLKTDDGRSIEVEIISNMYLVDQYKIIQCYVKDITDCKRAEEENEDIVNELNERIQELVFKNKEIAERAAELFIANKELTFQNQEKAYRAAELIIANKELAFQNHEKAERAAELIIANKELTFQNQEKAYRAAELIIANKELAFQNHEKADRAAELIIANKELTFQNQEKAYRAAELIIANKELAFQNHEKADRAAELIIANKELTFQNREKADRKAELIIINKEHNLQNKEKADRASELIIANAYLENLINYANAPIIVLDLQLHITHFNHAFEAITGRIEKAVIGKSLAMLFPPENISNSMRYFKNSMKEKHWETSELEIIHLDGSVRILMWNSAIIYDLDGITPVSIIGQGQDITDWKKAEKEILYLSYHDQLTGLYNRRFYEIELKRLDIERNLPFSIVMGDVNGLKLINDSFGHDMGDELLMKVGEVIKSGCRADDIIARLAGDEFVIILPKTDNFETEQLIKRITDLLLNQKVGSINISIAFGYATKNNEGEKIEEIFKKAEDHMYKRKIFESASIRAKTINVIINTLYEKSKREKEHSYRVSELCKNIGKALGLPEHEIEELKLIGLLHDIGKIAIDENILNKPGKLTEDEWKEIKRHPEIAFRILNTVNDISDMAKYVLYHHERWDGKGYPKGLKGEDIPYVSRIITIADAYDAMTSDRSYRSALPQKFAVEEMKKNAGTQFDYNLVNIFIEKVLGEISGV